MRRILSALLLLLAFPAQAQQVNLYWNSGSGLTAWQPVTAANPLPVTASVSASISGFTAVTTGTPISVTTGGVTGTLPAGAVVVATNVGTTNGAYCALGASATTSSQYLSAGGGWFAFTVGASTQLTCITSSSTTTVNMTGGAGLPTGTGGGGGGSSSNTSVSATGAAVPATATYVGINSGGNLTGWNGAVTNAGTFPVQAAQSGTWTVQPGNTANTTAWLVTGTGGTFPVTQGTASNLNATVVGTGTFVTQSTLAAETTKVIGTVRSVGNVGGVFDAVQGATAPANGILTGMVQGGNLVAVTGTSGNLNVQCANCSGSGVSTVDEATFTAGTSLFAGGGGFFQTTATNNALTNGQQGMWQMTANRAGFVNLRNAAGTEVGTAGAALRVDVTGATTQPVSGTITANAGTGTFTAGGVAANGAAASGNPVQIGGVYRVTPTVLDDGDVGSALLDVSGRLRVAVDSATGLAQGSTTSGQTGSLVMAAVTTASPSYTTAQTSPLSLDTAGSLRVAIVSGGGSGGTAAADESAFTAGTSSFTSGGGFFQTTATNNALTNGQWGAWQMTANRAGFINLRNAAGAEVGVTGAELFVGGRGTAGTAAGGVLTIQGVASMTKLLVTPDSVALPANQSVNVSQINAVTPLMGNGTTGTGSQRVTIASDNTAFAVNATLSAETTKVIGTARILGNAGAIVDGATGAAPPANVVYSGGLTSGATGGLLTGIVVCDQNAFLNMTTATTTEIVALTASRQIMVCSYTVTTNGTSAVKFVRGTGTNCGTGTNDVTANDEWTAQTGMTRGSGLGTLFRVTSANALCVTTGSAVNVHINVTYAVI